MNNKWQDVSTAPINKLVLVLVCGRGKPYGSLGMAMVIHEDHGHPQQLGMFEPTMEWHVNDEYLTESSDDQVIGWMELPQSNIGWDMHWIVH